MGTQKLLFIGTGYIAGSVLTLLLQEKKYVISATSRQDGHLAQLEEVGVQGIKASLDDAVLLEKAVYEHDIVINGASSDHPASVEATLRGIERRSRDGKHTIYIHTSGAGVLDDQSGGLHGNFVEYSDETPDQIESLPIDQPHRAVDKSIALFADQHKSTADIRILLPMLIYGEGNGAFNRVSMQTPALIRAGLARKQMGVFGKGLSFCSHVHVRDLARAYVLLLHALEQGKLPMRSNSDIYLFCDSGRHNWLELSNEIAKKLHARGLVSTPEVTSFSQKQLRDYGLEISPEKLHITRWYQATGANLVTKTFKLRELGWRPQEPAFFDSLDYDIDSVLAEQK